MGLLRFQSYMMLVFKIASEWSQCVDLKGIATPLPDGLNYTAIDLLFTRQNMKKYEEIA